MEEFRAIRQGAGWLGLALIGSEQLGHLSKATTGVDDVIVGAGIVLVTLSVFGPAAAAVLVRAFRGGDIGGGDSGE